MNETVTDNDVLSFAESIMSDKPFQEPTTTNTVEVEQDPAVEPAPNVETQVPSTESPIEFVISDEPQNLQVEPSTEVKEPVIDFDKAFQERIAKEFGIDVETAKARLAQVADLEAKANQNVYKSEQGRIFDELYAKGVPIETITNVAFKDLSGADNLQILDYQMQLKYPNSTAEERQAYLAQKYKIGEEYLEQEKLAGQFEMKKDVLSAQSEFDGLRADILKSPTEKQEALNQIKQQERVSVWEGGLTAKVVGELNTLEKKVKLNMSFDGKPNEKEVAVKIPFSAKDKEEMQEFLKVNLPHWNEATADANGQNFVREVLQNRFIVQNFDKIIQNVANNALSYSVEQQKQYLHNYQAPKNNTAVTQSGGTQQSDMDIVNGISAALGI